MEYAREEAAGGAPFDDEKDLRLLLIEQQMHPACAWEAMELIYRTVGTSDAAKHGAMIGRIFRNMAVIEHPSGAARLDRTADQRGRARVSASCRRRKCRLRIEALAGFCPRRVACYLTA